MVERRGLEPPVHGLTIPEPHRARPKPVAAYVVYIRSPKFDKEYLQKYHVHRLTIPGLHLWCLEPPHPLRGFIYGNTRSLTIPVIITARTRLSNVRSLMYLCSLLPIATPAKTGGTHAANIMAISRLQSIFGM